MTAKLTRGTEVQRDEAVFFVHTLRQLFPALFDGSDGEVSGGDVVEAIGVALRSCPNLKKPFLWRKI